VTRVALVLAHDGTDFAGWQLQPGLRTVQGVLAEALSTTCGREVLPQASGRTDAGVHAEAQVAHADVAERWGGDPDGLRRRLNALLPADLRVRACVPVGPGFDARKSARSKRYRYRWHVGATASPFTSRHRALVGMRDAAGRFVGERDFASLQTAGSSVETTVRSVTRCEVLGAEPEVALVVEGSGFLRHMVRAVAGCLLEVGRGRRPPRWIDELLAARDRAAAAANAPARGLCLEAVEYPEPWGVMIDRALAEQERAGGLATRAGGTA
jgi:tRNA pseudouridine38-40 synthase